MKIVAVIAFLAAAGAIADNEPEVPGRIDLAPNALPMTIKSKGKGRASKKDSCDKCILRCNDLAAEIHKSLATDALDRCNSKVCGPFVRPTAFFFISLIMNRVTDLSAVPLRSAQRSV